MSATIRRKPRGEGAWLYLASPAQGDETITVALAVEHRVVSRSAFNSKGALIANIGRLSPGDQIVLAYRRRRPAARVIATIAQPGAAVAGTTAIDAVREGPLLDLLRDSGYRLVVDERGVEVAHVIPLIDVKECDFELAGDYKGQTTLRPLAEVDLGLLDDENAVRDTRTETVLSVPREVPCVQTSTRAQPSSECVSGRTAFDAYIMVDWSASSSPSSGKDSLWVAKGTWSEAGALEIESKNPRTRQQAVDLIVQWCNVNAGRVLVGLDFAFGYPSGLATAAGLLQGDEQPWEAIHRHFGEHVRDGDSNRHNLYKVASSLNRCVSAHGAGPFWGCRQGEETNHLKPRRIGSFVFPYEGLNEWRRTEARARERATVQSVWKLYGGVSVGGQTIVGIHRLQQLRDRLRGRAQLWPFESGLVLPGQANTILLAEIFPSVVPFQDQAGGTVKDDRQVRSCVWFAANRDRRGLLAGDLGQPAGLDQSSLARLISEEGWILFCDTGPR